MPDRARSFKIIAFGILLGFGPSTAGALAPEDPAIKMCRAAREGRLELVTRLIRKTPQIVDLADGLGLPPLHWAALCGHGDIVEALLLVAQTVAALVAGPEGQALLFRQCARLSQAPAADFATNYETTGANTSVYARMVDVAGNTYIAGTISGAPVAIGNVTLARIGIGDAFVAKLDPSGNTIPGQGISADLAPPYPRAE